MNDRYMAKELLDWAPVQDLTKCDIFSLGITVYEMACSASQTIQPLTANGSEWQALRAGFIPLPENATASGLEMYNIITCMMRASPSERPTAVQCLEKYDALKSDLEKALIFEKKCNEALRDKLTSQTQTKKVGLKRSHTLY
jgi:serine/threonine protein kinase